MTLRKPIMSEALAGRLFRDQDLFEVLSGYATTSRDGTLLIKLFDLTIPPCEKFDQLGRAGRMVQIKMPSDTRSFSYDSLSDSQTSNGLVIFAEGTKQEAATSVEFVRNKLTSSSINAGLSAYDNAGNFVNGAFKVPRCKGNHVVVGGSRVGTEPQTEIILEQKPMDPAMTNTAVRTSTNTATLTDNFVPATVTAVSTSTATASSTAAGVRSTR